MKTFAERNPVAIGIVGTCVVGAITVAALQYDKLPFINPSKQYSAYFAEAGGLIAYGADPADGMRRLAYFTDRILKGTKPADLPAEEPTRFYLAINQKTAAALAIQVPQSILVQADRVIE